MASNTPRQVKIYISGTQYYITVDTAKCDCNREGSHCHIATGNTRVAKVWLNPVGFDGSTSISHNQQSTVLDAVRSNRYELDSAYQYNREHGAD